MSRCERCFEKQMSFMNMFIMDKPIMNECKNYVLKIEGLNELVHYKNEKGHDFKILTHDSNEPGHLKTEDQNESVHLINESVHLLLKNQFSFQLNWCIMHM
jgi:hypothetical protein